MSKSRIGQRQAGHQGWSACVSPAQGSSRANASPAKAFSLPAGRAALHLPRANAIRTSFVVRETHDRRFDVRDFLAYCLQWLIGGASIPLWSYDMFPTSEPAMHCDCFASRNQDTTIIFRTRPYTQSWRESTFLRACLQYHIFCICR
jgi:hypothetical protein